MKHNIVIATVVATLIGGGTATALAVSGDDEAAPATATRSSVHVKDDTTRDDLNGTDAEGMDDADDKNGTAGDRAEDAAEAKAVKLTAADAIEAALRHTSGTAVSVELDNEGTDLVWEVDILPPSGNTWHSVQIDPGTGKVLDSHSEHEDTGDTSQARAALKGTSVSAAEAADAAAAKGTVTSAELDDDGRTHAWDVETTGADGTESEWNVALDRTKVTADDSDD